MSIFARLYVSELSYIQDFIKDDALRQYIKMMH